MPNNCQCRRGTASSALAVRLRLDHPTRMIPYIRGAVDCKLRYASGRRRSLTIARFISAAKIKVAETRSEEHTSELQSLMRISYAVFCLKKKTKNNIHTDRIRIRYSIKKTKL